MSKGDIDTLEETFQWLECGGTGPGQSGVDTPGRVTGTTTQVENDDPGQRIGHCTFTLGQRGDPIVPLTSYQPGTEMAAIADMSD